MLSLTQHTPEINRLLSRYGVKLGIYKLLILTIMWDQNMDFMRIIVSDGVKAQVYDILPESFEYDKDQSLRLVFVHDDPHVYDIFR